MNKKTYPYHESLKFSLKSVDSVLLAMRLVRELSDMLDIESDEIEVLVGLAANKEPSTFGSICETVPHLTPEQVDLILGKLGRDDMVVKTTIEQSRKGPYKLFMITEMAAAAIKYVDKNRLCG